LRVLALVPMGLLWSARGCFDDPLCWDELRDTVVESNLVVPTLVPPGSGGPKISVPAFVTSCINVVRLHSVKLGRGWLAAHRSFLPPMSSVAMRSRVFSFHSSVRASSLKLVLVRIVKKAGKHVGRCCAGCGVEGRVVVGVAVRWCRLAG